MLVSYAKSVGLVESLLLGQIDVYEKKQGIMYLAPRGPMFHNAQDKYVYNVNFFLRFALCHEVMIDSIVLLYHRLLKNFVVMGVTCN
jgi:hypothetical protein